MQNSQTGRQKLSLAPVSYFWERDTLLDFYSRIADTPVDIVYLGETICSKRRSLDRDDWMTLAENLANAGKEVVLSTLTLVEASSELGTMQRLCDNDLYSVEANDMAAVQMRFTNKRQFVGGASLNIYNSETLAKLAEMGLKRWVVPVEHSAARVAEFEIPDGLETEVFAWGRIPLAYSARCYTARTHGTPKDDCQLRCQDYPDGLTLDTLEDETFLTLNGIQTQSARYQNLIHDLQHPGVDIYRISPQAHHTEAVIELFSRCLNDLINPQHASEQLAKLAPCGMSNGYWHGTAGMHATAGLQA